MFGELHPDYAEPFKFKQRVCLAEIDIELLLAGAVSPHVDPIPKFPAIRRDFSLLLEKGTQYATVRQTIANAGITELVSVEPFDRMESGAFPESKYSLSISVIYQSAERTLTDVEVESFDKKILTALEVKLGAQQRK
jgi:phenylalanyl-tRNA synthetase beta chain